MQQQIGTESDSSRRFDRVVVKLIALGIVVCGFATLAIAPWYAKPAGIPTVVLGIVIFYYPDPREHLPIWWRRRAEPKNVRKSRVTGAPDAGS